MRRSRLWHRVNTLLNHVILLVIEQQNTPALLPLRVSGTSAALAIHFSLLSAQNMGFSCVVVWKNILPVNAQVSLTLVF